MRKRADVPADSFSLPYSAVTTECAPPGYVSCLLESEAPMARPWRGSGPEKNEMDIYGFQRLPDSIN